MTEAPRIVTARAHALGPHLGVRDLGERDLVSSNPLTAVGRHGGHVVAFRFGAAVAVGMTRDEEQAVVEHLRERTQGAWDVAPIEEVAIALDGDADTIDSHGRISVPELDAGRIQVIANVLAKSAALTYYENRIAGIFDRVEHLAERLQRARRTARTRDLLRQIGDVLVTQVRMVARVEVSEKPEIVWDEPVLDRFYERLATEFELRDRDRALSRRLELISEVAGTYLELIHTRQTLRVEWYIVLLIVLEICLTLYEMFVRA